MNRLLEHPLTILLGYAVALGLLWARAQGWL
jgi:hypothetical protein